jgi:hypothetical protein
MENHSRDSSESGKTARKQEEIMNTSDANVKMERDFENDDAGSADLYVLADDARNGS